MSYIFRICSILLAFTLIANAERVTIELHGTVGRINNGGFWDDIQLGDPMDLTWQFDTNMVDTDSGPDQSIYQNSSIAFWGTVGTHSFETTSYESMSLANNSDMGDYILDHYRVSGSAYKGGVYQYSGTWSYGMKMERHSVAMHCLPPLISLISRPWGSCSRITIPLGIMGSQSFPNRVRTS